MDQVVPDGTAAKCDQDNCICTSHDHYHEIVAERIRDAKKKAEEAKTEAEDPNKGNQTDTESDISRWETLNKRQDADEIYMLCVIGGKNNTNNTKNMISLA